MPNLNIDFKKLHGFENGQRDSFENLICALGRRENFSAFSDFCELRGAGGDGGVEAYWFIEGKKIGYQAKYFFGLKQANNAIK